MPLWREPRESDWRTKVTMGTNKARNSNLELYRIVVMLAIVAHHYVVNSGLMGVMAQEPFSGRSIFYYPKSTIGNYA